MNDQNAQRGIMGTPFAPAPGCAVQAPVPGYEGILESYYVPVMFAALDWGVSVRRIRYLLTAGRLHGRRNSNGTWLVMHPYVFTFGRRGPPLKRYNRPVSVAE